MSLKSSPRAAGTAALGAQVERRRSEWRWSVVQGRGALRQYQKQRQGMSCQTSDNKGADEEAVECLERWELTPVACLRDVYERPD